MASRLRAELECSICLNIYSHPVMLKCGHNFCRVCVELLLDTQEKSGVFSCPECREEFSKRPVPERNRKLCNIVENFQSSQPGLQGNGISCTFCIDIPLLAVKSCLHCEASLCDNHLQIHSKSPEHVLCDPITSLESRKCSVHKKILEYYCPEDSKCICVSCRLDGEHRGHQVETIDEASEKKKEKLRHVLKELLAKTEEMEKRDQSLQEHKSKVEEKAVNETERVVALFKDLRRRLEDLEKKVLKEISGQTDGISLLIQQLEIKKEEMSRKMRHIEELCNMTDPLTVLQDTDGFCDTEDKDDKDGRRYFELPNDGGDLDVAGISHTLHTGLSNIITGINGAIYIAEPVDILLMASPALDLNTAHNNLLVSDGKKTTSLTCVDQNRPLTPKRFQGYPQVLSCQSFSSGRHYWEVDIRGSPYWRVGMCYPSINRKGERSQIGFNAKSWCLCDSGLVIHDSKSIQVSHDDCGKRFRIYLDYEAGKISFYEMSVPIQHLHTFTTTFTEPLHAVIGVGSGCIKIRGGRERSDKFSCRLLTSMGYGRFPPFPNQCNLQ
ncbi:E3 ubiquitin-protein ligase TRIM39-like [Rana temporaria]|uniref:E3 ubiquitin-protein ligase TRIM39-like n=1 Tax=Rana temporaria TaxID=8407 RepID=UPI001AAC65A3|nr:E3 ubiquitin-protein ligase TRIM39-like [Rana temporaria]